MQWRLLGWSGVSLWSQNLSSSQNHTLAPQWCSLSPEKTSLFCCKRISCKKFAHKCRIQAEPILSHIYATNVNDLQHRAWRNHNSGTPCRGTHWQLVASLPMLPTVLVPVVVVVVAVEVVVVMLLPVVLLICAGLRAALTSAPFFSAFCLCLLPANNNCVWLSSYYKTGTSSPFSLSNFSHL
jgi:hypothetical protein